MTLKLGPITDDKSVKLTLDVPADVFRDLAAYAKVHAVSTGRAPVSPSKLIVPMLAQFMASDRGFAKMRRALPGD